jgi:hypothetical protein
MSNLVSALLTQDLKAYPFAILGSGFPKGVWQVQQGPGTLLALISSTLGCPCG